MNAWPLAGDDARSISPGVITAAEKAATAHACFTLSRAIKQRNVCPFLATVLNRRPRRLASTIFEAIFGRAASHFLRAGHPVLITACPGLREAGNRERARAGVPARSLSVAVLDGPPRFVYRTGVFMLAISVRWSAPRQRRQKSRANKPRCARQHIRNRLNDNPWLQGHHATGESLTGG